MVILTLPVPTCQGVPCGRRAGQRAPSRSDRR
jgi:hypothetical protein